MAPPSIPEENKDLFIYSQQENRTGDLVKRKLYEKKYDKGLRNTYASKKNRFEENLLRSKPGGGYMGNNA